VALAPHKRNIGLVFQNYALFPHLDIRRNVSFPLEMRGVSRAEIERRVSEALHLVRLAGFESRRPKQLSGGQQQRVALARALVFRPPVLLLDEPLGALDAKLREQMKLELKELHQSIGSTILFVTHDQEEALTLSDRIAVFKDGQVVQVGRPDELYRHPVNRFVADFIGETNLLTGEVTSADSRHIRISTPAGIEFVGLPRAGFSMPCRQATFALRLEDIAFGGASEGMANRFRGSIEQFLYVGNSTKYVVRIGRDFLLTARHPERTNIEPLKPGTEIDIGWRESDLLLVEVDRTGRAREK
jgi:ABC-type Fe3+/spermidine/putrescine transport system ATPase subunit